MGKLILNEKSFKKLINSTFLNEAISNKEVIDVIKNNSEIENYIKTLIRKTYKDDNEIKNNRKETISNIIKSDKELEKRVANIVIDVLLDYHKFMWQRSSFLTSDLRR